MHPWSSSTWAAGQICLYNELLSARPDFVDTVQPLLQFLQASTADRIYNLLIQPETTLTIVRWKLAHVMFPGPTLYNVPAYRKYDVVSSRVFHMSFEASCESIRSYVKELAIHGYRSNWIFIGSLTLIPCPGTS